MFFRLDLLVTPHPKSLGLDAAYWTPEADGGHKGRATVTRGRRLQVRRAAAARSAEAA